MVSKSRWGNKNWRMTSRGLDMLSVLRCYLRLGLWHVAAVEVAIQLGQEFCFQVDRRPDTTCLGLGERETLTVTSHNPVQIERNYSTPVTIKVNKQITQNTATVGGRRREKDFGLFLTTVIGRPAKKARRPAKNSLFLCSVASGFLPISRRLDCTRNGRLRGT
ncbi:hypothetical protein M0657_005732 [Pyricularia oryzae]|uniref:Uncharacterized protein n=1 Tax=Pyricularia oryzae TaxID=318829 RepID=A0A4P7N3I1_PYROR|nr:hypothetical protein M9X92_005908 [Pyricularia oryzae]KAI7922187.1 hypothetical protein M0657_005732 [Pyricularia oryzae]QBZ54480.1 hypothetical protein PoMZ_10180 [Pyricularia oryzae]